MDPKDDKNMNFKKIDPAPWKYHFSVLSYTEKWTSLIDDTSGKFAWIFHFGNIRTQKILFSNPGLPYLISFKNLRIDGNPEIQISL